MVEVTDYHDFTWPACSVEHRKRFGVGNLYINAAICSICMYFVRSRNRHDFRACKCGNLKVDGGSQYARRIGDSSTYVNVIVPFDTVEE